MGLPRRHVEYASICVPSWCQSGAGVIGCHFSRWARTIGWLCPILLALIILPGFLQLSLRAAGHDVPY